MDNVDVAKLLELSFSVGVSWYLLVYVRRSLDDLREAILKLTIAIADKEKLP